VAREVPGGGLAEAAALRGDHSEPGEARATRSLTPLASYLRIEERGSSSMTAAHRTDS
jgi:hypothetical protein